MFTTKIDKTSESCLPLVSVITVVFNGQQSIEATIQSVVNQTYPNIQYIIIDGGSSDGTLDIIRKYESKIENWISEPDKGIYDAMNKGIDRATGNWIYFIGSGDKLASVATMALLIDSIGTSESELVVGDVEYDSGRKFISCLNWRIKIRNTVHHQAALYRRSIFNNFRYETQFGVYSDYELNLILFITGTKVLRVSQTLALCTLGGVSDKAYFRNYVEELKIKMRHLDLFQATIFAATTVVRFLLKRSYIALGMRSRR